MKRIYVGNIHDGCREEDLQALFSQFENVERITIVTDKETGQPRGFAFVEMTSAEDAQNAIQQLDCTRLHGRVLTVDEARPGGSRFHAILASKSLNHQE